MRGTCPIQERVSVIHGSDTHHAYRPTEVDVSEKWLVSFVIVFHVQSSTSGTARLRLRTPGADEGIFTYERDWFKATVSDLYDLHLVPPGWRPHPWTQKAHGVRLLVW